MLDELGGRMLAVIETFAQQNGYDLVLDTSSPESGLLHFDPQIDITQPVIPEYDPFTETREYVLAVLRNAEIYRRLYNLPLRGRSFGAAAGS